jgi:hypothetical protein
MDDTEKLEYDERQVMEQYIERLCDKNKNLLNALMASTSKNDELHKMIKNHESVIAAGHRLALELECLLMDTKDLATVSKWWDSAREALDEWGKLFEYNGPELKDNG